MRKKDYVNIPITDLSNYFVVSDFDRTITSGISTNSWCVLDENESVCEEYKQEMEALQNHYHKIEIDPNVPDNIKFKEMTDWWNKHLELFIKYKFTEDLFHKTSSDKSVMELRKGFKRFLNFLKERNVPLVIISAGLTNVIKAFLIEHEIDLDNIYIISNEIYFENGVAKGIAHDIIHSMNKSEVSLPEELNEKLKGRNNVLLFGDNLKDYLMVDKENHDDVLEVAFVNEENKKYTEDFFENYDIILDENEDFDTVLEKIIK